MEINILPTTNHCNAFKIAALSVVSSMFLKSSNLLQTYYMKNNNYTLEGVNMQIINI